MRTGMRCGELVIGGFPGTALPASVDRALRSGALGGTILFKGNVEGGVRQVAALTRQLHAASPDRPALVCVDQEGGRVARLKAPLLEVPPMRTIASWGDVALGERIAGAVGAELGALGFTVDFAPVLDVNTRPENPVIGDRAFGSDPATCATWGAAWTRGLQRAGLLACGKHFPGHGDTTKDSHHELPTADATRERLDAIELVPFRAAVRAGVAMLMTAHVVYPAIDPLPATLAPAHATELRAAVGFEGVLVSDDLEMKAIAARWSIEESAVLAVAAGCDALLVCWTAELQERAVAALEREAERSAAFRARVEQAQRRLREARDRIRVRPLDDAAIDGVLAGQASRGVADAIVRRLAS